VAVDEQPKIPQNSPLSQPTSNLFYRAEFNAEIFRQGSQSALIKKVHSKCAKKVETFFAGDRIYLSKGVAGHLPVKSS